MFIKDSSLYNYADDNTLSFGSPDFDLLISTLESDSNHLIEWFKINKMQANPDKFQVLAVGKKTYEKRPTIQNFELTCEDSVKLLGIEIDYQLNFDTHISTICRKASQQLNIIKRLGPYLNRLRDRPFNLKGGGGGGVCFFVSFRSLFSDKTRVRIIIFFVAQSANFFSSS